ncbi:hypothetical protein H4R35_002552 [Dimargaris xerosporica]|nr:hypothetical protein H4R35_002552 [Dimargaris xerosporica]
MSSPKPRVDTALSNPARPKPSTTAAPSVGSFGAFQFGSGNNAPARPRPSERPSRPDGMKSSASAYKSPMAFGAFAAFGGNASASPSSTDDQPLPSPEVAQLLESDIPLQHRWAFWLDTFSSNQQATPAAATEYEQYLKVVGTVGTVQEFWGAVNHMRGPETLKARQCYHFMKEGIKPVWEDPMNQNGGSYVFRVDKSYTPVVWRELLMALVGEQLNGCLLPNDVICGVSCSNRWNVDMFQVWHSNADCQTPKVMEHLQSCLSDIPIKSPYYKAHRDHSGFKAKAEANGHPEPTTPQM